MTELSSPRRASASILAAVALVVGAQGAAAQAGQNGPVALGARPSAPASAVGQAVSPADGQATDDQESRDRRPDPVQPDFTVVNLPTTLRLPQFRSAFRVTHRFARPLGDGDFGDLVSDFFGFDSGAQIGLEFRFGVWRGAQVGIHRTSDKTIQFFGQYPLLDESESVPLGLAAWASTEGTNNFKDSYSPALGAIVSKKLGRYGAVYVQPIWVNNTNVLPSELVDDNDTFLIGVGARLRVRPTVYLVGEIAPRVSGYDPGTEAAHFGIEKRAGGHVFQLNFSTSLGTTMGQVARGGESSDTWYIGFNISRKFY